jgi:EAL and modified HD-GYP domain-containing signal transduction protein
LAGELRHVARQPILDRHGNVEAYELLYRAGADGGFSGNADHATRTMLDNSVVFGLDALAAGLPAFVNCTMESLVERLVDVLPPSSSVLEILETIEPTPILIAACRELKVAGYRLALDDFIWEPKFEPLIELADYIKVDFLQADAAARQILFKQLKGAAVTLLAEKIETQKEFMQAWAEGFTLFQGYYFCRPLLTENRKVPANRLAHFQILELLQHEPLNLHQLSQLVKQDASLSYRFLRLVNSPVCAIRQEVRSIKATLLVLGDDAIRRIATLAITSELNGNQPLELLRMGFVRARFCELAARFCALEPAEQYLLGLFSLLPAMMRVPMTDLTPMLPLRKTIREALMGAASLESCLLHWVEFHERGDWVHCDAIVHSYSLKMEPMVRCYAEAVIWADAALHFAR